MSLCYIGAVSLLQIKRLEFWKHVADEKEKEPEKYNDICCVFNER